MSNLSKSSGLLLILIMVIPSLSLLAIRPAFAQSTSKPSVPQFIVNYVDYSYDVPPKYGVDQYTGQNITIQAGYHVDGRSVEFTIKNQPFISFDDSSGNYTNLYYNFRFKGTHGNSWTYYPFDGNVSTHTYGGLGGPSFIYYSASNADYTNISITLEQLTEYTGAETPPEGTQVEFQVQAQFGYIYSEAYSVGMGSGYFFTGQTSDWSDTQTITIGQVSSSSSTPTVSELPWLVILPLLLSVFCIAILIRHRKTDNLKQ